VDLKYHFLSDSKFQLLEGKCYERKEMSLFCAGQRIAMNSFKVGHLMNGRGTIAGSQNCFQLGAHLRRLSVASPLHARRSSGPLNLSPLSGNLSSDGLSRYELDFMETAKWSIRLIESMKADVAELKSMRK
jgi:hypothetical protein